MGLEGRFQASLLVEPRLEANGFIKSTKRIALSFSHGRIARKFDEQGLFDNRLGKKAAELGFPAVFVSKTYEGMGLAYLKQCLIAEEFAPVD